MTTKIGLFRTLFLPSFLLRTAIFLCLLNPESLFSQPTNISGIVNTYHKVLQVFPSQAGVRVDNTSGLTSGDLVVIIQMKGAQININNTSAFGDTISLNNAGNYELATICEVINDTVFFFHTLLNNYTVTNQVQLVKFGSYYSANVVDTVKAASWNNSTGKGGVLAIRAEEDITLNAPLFADSTGYRGASFLLHSGNCTNFLQSNAFYYDGNDITAFQSGAFKGEAVVDLASNMDGGRGAPANGGGGGNNHNNGGGGGANLVAGGIGGGNFSTTGCTSNFQGRGGKALSSWGGTKIFAGGGGGAGHANSNSSTHGGGNGGGIIILLANTINGNGYKISAKGQPGGSNISDGASGGGAGGTIIMSVSNYNGSLTIETTGGNGGNSDNDLLLNRCYGAGGGGGGGIIYFNGSIPSVTTSVSGGNAGNNIDINGCGAQVPAFPGTNGYIITSYAYRASTDSSNYCSMLVLPVRLISFNAVLTSEKKVLLDWEVANPQEAKSFTVERLNSFNEWKAITTVFASGNSFQYQARDEMPKMGENIYRLRMIGNDNSILYSSQKRIFNQVEGGFSVYPNPAKDKITIVGKFMPETKLQLCNLSGKIIFEKTISDNNTIHQFFLPNLPEGIYLLKTNHWIEKLIIR